MEITTASTEAHFIMKLTIRSVALTFFSLCSIALWYSPVVHAEPYLAIKNNVKCSACHINPIGGGMRSTYGNFYGHNSLPATSSDLSSAEVGKITEWLGVGGNFRYNAEHIQDDADNSASTFKVESAQIYLAVTPKNSPVTFYIDQQVAPGAAINREAFVLYRFSGLNYVKAGKMFVPFGLRLEDDSSFVRQATGFNFDNSDNGIELGLETGKSALSLFVTNGTGSVSNNDDRFLYGMKAEHLFNNFRVGATLVFNDGSNETQSFYNLYAGATWKDFTFLAEVDLINTESTNEEANVQKDVFAALFEINYQVLNGFNLKVTSEFLDPDIDISDNHETRYSVIVEYAPISNIQFRGGVRVSDSIPQRPERASENLFLQTHLYF